jgi:hypothetical protein
VEDEPRDFGPMMAESLLRGEIEDHVNPGYYRKTVVDEQYFKLRRNQ